MDEAFLRAFSEVVRQQVAHKHEMDLEGIGTFKPIHKNQYQQQYQDGRVLMMPPKDTIKFTPCNKQKNG
jgi:nucleoid DNA-binding protein